MPLWTTVLPGSLSQMDWTIWCNDEALNMHSEGTWFELRPGFFVIYCVWKRVTGYYLEINHNILFLNSFLHTINDYFPISFDAM
jgi:hypothetical protein